MVVLLTRKIDALELLNKLKITINFYSTRTAIVQNADNLHTSRTNRTNQVNGPKVETISCDMIGPPHPLSNLRPIIRHRPPDETPSQEKLRKLQIDTQIWNQSFWESHNAKFIKERESFLAKQQGDKKLNADEMSEFYKDFLDKNWKSHLDYNREWYGRNLRILALSIRVLTESIMCRAGT